MPFQYLGRMISQAAVRARTLTVQGSSARTRTLREIDTGITTHTIAEMKAD